MPTLPQLFVRFCVWMVLPATLWAHGVDVHRIPLGDNKISASPRKGYVYACQSRFQGGGAHRQGDWIQGDVWDLTRKIQVQGSVSWPQARFESWPDNDTRLLAGNGLPTSGTTGIYPIQAADPAYQFDRNPNAIRPQDWQLRLPRQPELADSAHCVGMGPIGMTLTGVWIFNALDDQGRDAVAHEVQDRCNGHPERQGRYHYHGPSPCLPGLQQANAVIGYALDGFAITSPRKPDGQTYGNEDLDECHGRVDVIELDGKPVRSYHYVLTQEYPYTVGCYRGVPVAQAAMGGADNRPGSMPPPAGASRMGPPPEARQACQSRQVGDSCRFVTPRGDTLTGQCGMPAGNTLACLPSHPPRPKP